MKIDYLKARQLAVTCQEVYKSFTDQRFEAQPETTIPIDNRATDTQCLLMVTAQAMTIVFRGSDSAYDWQGNLNTQQMRVAFEEAVIQRAIVDRSERQQIYPYASGSASGAKLHSGFSQAYLSVRDQIHSQVDAQIAQGLSTITVTGHSLGGALALLCAVDLQYNFADRLQHLEVYSFGAPRVGNKAFKESFDRRVPHSYRFVHGMDIVVELPRWWQGYPRHVAQQIRIGPRLSWELVTAPFKDHAIADYIAALDKQIA
ncbi:MAG: lipase family protein [Synechococcales cyanobacterium RM1_1_8]|nr:lipase family protein [Synechococcales cyanobacterium RM1_1_8]